MVLYDGQVHNKCDNSSSLDMFIQWNICETYMKHSSSMLSLLGLKCNIIFLFDKNSNRTLLPSYLIVIIVLFAYLHVLLDNKVMTQQSIRAFIRIARSFSSLGAWMQVKALLHIASVYCVLLFNAILVVAVTCGVQCHRKHNILHKLSKQSNKPRPTCTSETKPFN